MFVAVLLAAAGFTVLTASSASSRLETIGTVQNQSSTNYDLLVRPTGSRSPIETARQVIQSGFLSGVFGGITMRQWHDIQTMSGVDVAAPIAMVGYVVPQLKVPVDLTADLPRGRTSLARVDASWSTDAGLSHESSPASFVYVTPKRLQFREGTREAELYSTENHGRRLNICPYLSSDRGTPTPQQHSQITCMSWDGSGDKPAGLGLGSNAVGTGLDFPFPFLIAAIDPASEDKLSGLTKATAAGTRLADSELSDKNSFTRGKSVPVLVGNVPQTDLKLKVSASKLPSAAAARVLAGASGDDLRNVAHKKLWGKSYSSQTLYPQLIRALREDGSDFYATNNISQLFTVGTPRFTGSTALTPQPQKSTLAGRFLGPTPPTMDDTPFRSGATAQAPQIPQSHLRAATLRYVDTFDPTKLTGIESITDRLLNGLVSEPLEAADPHARTVLGGSVLPPSPNVTGLAQPAPLMLTSLNALAALQEGWSGPASDDGMPTPGGITYAQPISAIRVRVLGVRGIDDVSRERVRVVAQQIRDKTGLDVDVTTGASPYEQRIDLPAGSLGRPVLHLEQWWAKKGVATAIISALDTKSVALFTLVLLVAGLSVANSAVASVRTRRRELAVLACLGWRQKDLFRTVKNELAILGLSAGVVAAALSFLAGGLLNVDVSPGRALLAIPAALLITVSAALFAAFLAARTPALDAIRGGGATARRGRGRPTRTLLGFALANVRRSPGRAVLAASGLAVAIAAFSVLLSVTFAFQGTAVGTLMGNAVTLQVRAVDYIATASALGLAVAGVVTVVVLNVRDRAGELAVLHATGWTDRAIASLVAFEGVAIGLLGAIPGVVLGLAGTTTLVGTPTGAVFVGACAAAFVGFIGVAVGGFLPLPLLRNLAPATLLTEEEA